MIRFLVFVLACANALIALLMVPGAGGGLAWTAGLTVASGLLAACAALMLWFQPVGAGMLLLLAGTFATIVLGATVDLTLTAPAVGCLFGGAMALSLGSRQAPV